MANIRNRKDQNPQRPNIFLILCSLLLCISLGYSVSGYAIANSAVNLDAGIKQSGGRSRHDIPTAIPTNGAPTAAKSADISSSPSITLTGPAPNLKIAEANDYATQVLHDPWDMNDPGDVDEPYNVINYGVSNGLWTGTTTTTASSTIFLQYRNIENHEQTNGSFSYLGEESGANYPISSTQFTRLWVRMYSQLDGQSIAWFFPHLDNTGLGNSSFMPVTPGWHIYTVDLRSTSGGGSGTWTANGPYQGLRFDLPWANAAGNAVQLDWARLTPDAGISVPITWSTEDSGNVKLYLSYSPVATDDNELLIATVPSSAGTYTWNTTGMAPGSYYIHAELNGATSSIGPLVVNTAPIVRIDAPSPLSGEEYSYAEKAVSWDGTNSHQFQEVANVSHLTYAPENIHGVPTTGDPQLFWLKRDARNALDANKYHYLSVRFMLQPPASRPWSPKNSGTRVLWAGSDNLFSTSYALQVPYNQWIPAEIDLRNVPLTEQQANDWSGDKASLRFDPLEDDVTGQPPALPAGFTISAAHLTSDPVAGRMGAGAGAGHGTIIRWAALQGTGTLDLYRQSGSGSTLIASGLPIGDGQYYWDTSSVPTGTYTITTSITDGINSSTAKSLVAIKVDPSQPSTIFNDVPGNLWAVDYINRLARLNVIGGTTQTDTSVLFKPNNQASRGQLSKLVVLSAGWSLDDPPTPTFNDVITTSTFFRYVETAVSHGVINGYGCGGANEPCPGRYFRPGNNVTRAQTTKMVSISRGWNIVAPTTPTFADMAYDPAQGSLYSYVETSVGKGIISGYACGAASEPCDSQNRPYFRPSNNVTRAQLSKMLSLALDIP